MMFRNCVFAAMFAFVIPSGGYAEGGPASASSAAHPHQPIENHGRLLHRVPTEEQTKLLLEIKAMDAETDRLARCLRYPDSPGVQWNQDEVKLLCHMQFDPLLTLSQLRLMFDAKGGGALELYFNGLRKAQGNPETSWKLDEAFHRTFSCACKDARDLADAWLSRSPESLWGNVARGLQYGAAAAKARGTEYIKDTGPERLARMSALDAKAAKVLERVLSQHKDITPAIGEMVWIDAREGRTREARDRLAAALREHRGNLSLHQTAASLYQGKWLGSDAELDAEKARAQEYAVENPLLILVVSQIDWKQRSCDKDCTWTRSDIDAMNHIGPSLPVLRQMVRMDMIAGDYASAIIEASEVLRLSPTSELAIRTQRGVSRADLGDAGGAEADAEAALSFKPGYEPALTLLQRVALQRSIAAKPRTITSPSVRPDM